MYKTKKNDCFREVLRIQSIDDITRDNLQVVISGMDSACPTQFSAALTQHMNRVGCTIDQLSEATYVSARTIQRMRSSQDCHLDVSTLVALCVGLHLDVYDSRVLLQLAGFCLTGSPRDRAYQVILNYAYKENVADCNRFLLRLGFSPLTKEK